MPERIRVTVWGENVHERANAIVRQIYPDGMHNCIAAGLREDSALEVATATLQERSHGLTKSVLDATDVLVWWGHAAHGKVKDAVVEQVLSRVWEGMGFIALHSSHYAKVFKRLMGTSCSLTWREAGERERLWVCNPRPPHRARPRALFRNRKQRDVWRALCHSNSGRNCFPFLV